MDTNVTKASDVAIPATVVTLKCESVDELFLAKVYGMPGIKDTGIEDKKSKKDPMVIIGFADKISPDIIHAATALVGSDGESEVRPAFYFDKDHDKGGIDGKFLRLEDKLALVNAILENSGLGGAASEVAFPDGKRGRRSRGVGAVENGEGDGEATTPVAGNGGKVRRKRASRR
jgi:hypothetical protein